MARSTARPAARGQRRFQRGVEYSVHQVIEPSGLTIAEYADTMGVVFAVSWSGSFRPNLRRLMGAHYEPYVAAARGRRAQRGGVSRIELPGLVVVIGGNQRASFGKLYLTGSFPGPLRPEDLSMDLSP